MRYRARIVLMWLLAALISAATCARIAPYSEEAYKQAVSLKVDALALMDSATSPFSQHASQVQALLHRVDGAYEYANGRPDNDLSARQWAIVRADSGASLGSFLVFWRRSSTLSAGAVEQAKIEIGRHFDQIIALESGKIKPKDVHP